MSLFQFSSWRCVASSSRLVLKDRGLRVEGLLLSLPSWWTLLVTTQSLSLRRCDTCTFQGSPCFSLTLASKEDSMCGHRFIALQVFGASFIISSERVAHEYVGAVLSMVQFPPMRCKAVLGYICQDKDLAVLSHFSWLRCPFRPV